MKSRAVCRCKGTASRVEAMLLTPWRPHLNLPGCHRQQRPAYEELTEARTLSKIPLPEKKTTTKQKQKPAEMFVTLPSDAEQPTKRQRHKKNPREPTRPGPSASSSCAADVPKPQVPRDNVQDRHRPAEVNTVLMLARAYNGNEIAAWRKNQEALNTVNLQERHKLINFGVVEEPDRPPSQQVLSTRWVQKTAAGRILQHANCGKRI